MPTTVERGFYVGAQQVGDVLASLPRAQPRRLKPKPYTPPLEPRKRRFKPVTEDFVVAILRESDRPLSSREIRERLEAQGREPLSRQAMSYVLLQLVRRKKARRIAVKSGPTQALWLAR